MLCALLSPVLPSIMEQMLESATALTLGTWWVPGVNSFCFHRVYILVTETNPMAPAKLSSASDKRMKVK